MLPCKISDGWQRTWQTAQLVCTSKCASRKLLMDTTTNLAQCMWGVLIPVPTTFPSEIQAQPSTDLPSLDPSPPHPIVWWSHFSPDVVDNLVSCSNPTGGTTKSYLEMASSVLHHDCVANYFDVRECTFLSWTYKMEMVCWKCKGSATSKSAPIHLMWNHALHQQFFRYVPQHGFVRGINNAISNLPSRSSHLTDANLLHYFNTHTPHPLPWRMLNPSINSVSCSVSMLQQRPLLKACLLQDLPPPIPTGKYGPPSAPMWPLNHYSCFTSTPVQIGETGGGS